EKYTITIDANAQAIDHEIVNVSMLGRFNRIAYGRIDADFPDSYRADPNRPERISDHDPEVAYFALTSTPTNVALASNGSTAIASSSHASGNYPAMSAINGSRTGNNWGNASSPDGWNDGTRGLYPDSLEVDFSGSNAINEIRVYTLQNNWTTAGEPTVNTPATGEGVLDFQVQTWNGAAWVMVPGGSVTGNDKAMRVF